MSSYKQCPVCDSTHIHKSGHTKKGSQRYYCCNCGRRFTDNPKIVFENKDIHCPICNSLNISKKGFTRNRNQRYFCRDCGKRFVIKYPSSALTENDKKIIMFYYKNFGVSVKSLAENLHHSQETISKFIKEGIREC